MDSNQILADWAGKSLDFYDKQAEGHRVLTDEGAFPMLLASMMHLADAKGWKFDSMLRLARKTYRSEREEANGGN